MPPHEQGVCRKGSLSELLKHVKARASSFLTAPTNPKRRQNPVTRENWQYLQWAACSTSRSSTALAASKGHDRNVRWGPWGPMGLCRTISLVPGTQQQQFPSATPASHTLSRGYLVECCATSAQLCHYQLSVVLAARWRVSVSSAPTLPSLGLAHMLISAINDRGNMPKETRHFLSFNLIYIFFLKNCSEKTPCLIHW